MKFQPSSLALFVAVATQQANAFTSSTSPSLLLSRQYRQSLNVASSSASSSSVPLVADDLPPQAKGSKDGTDAISELGYDPNKLTKKILEAQLGTIDKDLAEMAFRLIWSWGKTETVSGAETAERLIDRLEQEVEAGNDLVQLSNKHYTVAVDAWGKSGKPDESRRILEKMEQWSETKPHLIPTRVTYNAIMNSYARLCQTDHAIKVLKFMESSPDEQVKPNTNDYNVMLNAYSQMGAARDAEDLLKRMVERCKKYGDPCLCEPDLVSYNTLLDAWSRSNERARGARSEEILKALLAQSKSGKLKFEPDARTYSATIASIVRSNESDTIRRAEEVWKLSEDNGCHFDIYLHSTFLDAYASSTEPGAAEAAEKLLDKMETEGLGNAVAYNTVLKAWKMSRTDEAPERAESILRRMEARKCADTISYTTVIAALATKGTQDSAKKAEDVLVRMEKNGAKPNVRTVNSIINAWAKCGNMEKAEAILTKMETSFYNKLGKMEPNVISYATVMNGHTKSQLPDATNKAQAIFDRLQAMYKAGNKEAQANQISYITLVNAIVRSKEADAPERAEKVLFQMYQEFQDGNKQVKPNTQVVSSIIDCWQKSGKSVAGERAEALLEWLIKVYNEEKDPDLCPNEYTFAATIGAWSKTRVFGKAKRANDVLERMNELHKSGVISARPNAYCYTAVINSCAYSQYDLTGQKDAINIAIKSFKDLQNSSYGEPNNVTYSALITAIRNLMPPSDKRAAAINQIFNYAATAGQVDGFMVQRAQSSLDTAQQTKLFGAALTSTGIIDLKQLPEEWMITATTRRNAQ